MLLAMENKTWPTKLAETLQMPVFHKTLHRLRPKLKATIANPKFQKRNNIFSKSRDTHEDRGTRKMKTAGNSKMLFHVCALL